MDVLSEWLLAYRETVALAFFFFFGMILLLRFRLRDISNSSDSLVQVDDTR